jgi:mono/diheme cytochrome c family protein
MKLKLFLAAICVFALSTGATSFAQSAGDVYKMRCQMCHGADGKGDTVVGKKTGARDFHGPEVTKEPDSELFTITKTGKNKMPPYAGKLTDDQIKELVIYCRSLK